MDESEGLKQGLVKAFGDSVASNDELLKECISICQLYKLKPENLLWKWEANKFSGSTRLVSEISVFNMDSIASIKSQITRELRESSKRKQQTRPNVFSANLQRPRFTANSAKSMPAVIKTETGDVDVGGSVGVSFRGPRSDDASKKRRTYRYMYEKVSERSEALDDKIDELAEFVRDHYGITELGDPSQSTDGDVSVVGRITQDIEAATSSSKLNETTICLESSRMLGSGSRVPLRFNSTIKIRGCIKNAGSVGLFPGAIVALKGKNGGGGWFQVSEILALPSPRPMPAFGPSKINSDLAGAPFTMCVACGPYTPDTDLQYKQREPLFEYLKTTKPNVVLLMGPFVDSSHPRIKIGDSDTPPSMIYQARFLNPLKSFLGASPESIVLLLPSVRDLLSDHAVHPQGEYPERLTGGHPRIRLLPNPARFTINGVTFAATSVDILFHLRREEFVKRGEEIDPIQPVSEEDTGTDTMGNLCRHLLQQRSFYPLFPVPMEVSPEVNLDVSHSDSLRIYDAENQYAPDVLIVPSKLKEFSKMVHSTRAINPSYVNKMKYTILRVAGGETPAMSRITVTLAKFEGSGA
ncbi:hypothetical protein AX15_000185 [Amanita polypyramis BW_CC]|nr:hypothetical protein AX15_000185 [Amanita polypyramis BW_CC]